MSDTVPLSVLLDTLLQKAYNDLTILQELLPRKSDGDRKLEIVQYARRTRSMVIRLLGLVKWAGNSKSLDKCSEMSTLLRDQSWLYINTADQLANLSRGILLQACTPNFTLAPAVDVLTTGSYPRLPTCVRDKIVPLPSLTDDQSEEAFFLIECAIRRRLLREELPTNLQVKSIGRGVVTFVVPYEFELSLSVVGDDVTLPWRLVSLKILVGNSLPGSPILVHELQRVYLHQLIQSRLCATDSSPLKDCYHCVHTFCLSLQLDCLHSQANRLGLELLGSYVKVEEYRHGHHMKLAYWRPGTSNQLISTFLLNQSRTSSPKLSISIDSSKDENPFTMSHAPPLPSGSKVSVSAAHLSLESLLKECVSVRSHSVLSELKESLGGTTWDQHAVLSQSPLSLTVTVPLKYSSRSVVLGVDQRVGQIIVSLEPSCHLEGVANCLDDMDRTLTSAKDQLPLQLNALQCQLFLAHICECASDLGYKVQWSLPLLKPLPFSTSAQVYVQLQPQTFLAVTVGEGLIDQYHLVVLEPATGELSGDEWMPPPVLFYQATSVLELEPEQVYFDHLRRVLVRERGSILKRKLQESELELPSKKRLCVYSSPMFSPLPVVINTRITLLHMETSLRNASIIPHHSTYTSNGAPSLNIFEFPLEVMESQDVHELLSSHLQSCQVSPAKHNYSCTFVFSNILELPVSSSEVVLCQIIPSSSDLGQELLGQWRARLVLLGLALELQHYLQDENSPLAGRCTISYFSYDKLSVTFGKHTLDITGSPKSIHLSFSDLCPHTVLREHMETFLDATRSLPLLLTGLCATEVAMTILADFTNNVPMATLTAVAPPQVQLKYDHLPPSPSVLHVSLQGDSSVLFTDLTYNRPNNVLASSPPITPLNYLKVFLQATLGEGVSSDSDETTPPLSSTPLKRTLHPVPSPITHPRPSIWAAPSPRELSIPSIPPLGSYPSPGSSRVGVAPRFGGWSFTASLDEFRELLICEDGVSCMERFIGGVTLLFHFITTASRIVPGQQPLLHFVQCDRGMCTYRSDNLSLSLSMDKDSLKLTVRPARENVWSQNELDTLTAFFHREVVTRPFAVNAMTSFINMIKFPLPSLKSFVQLLQLHMVPPPSSVWKIRVCLTLPDDSSLVGTPFAPGHQAMMLAKKLIIFFELTRNEDGYKLLVPIVHDPKTNETYITKSRNSYLHPVHQFVDTILKKTVAECISGPNQGRTSSLFMSISVLSKSSLPIT